MKAPKEVANANALAACKATVADAHVKIADVKTVFVANPEFLKK